MKVSLILPSYRRSDLLELGLFSLAQQSFQYDLEVIVINDGIVDETYAVVEKYQGKLNIKYIFTGHRNLKVKPKFRSPSIAINVGIKSATGDIIILSNPEVFHLNNTVNLIVELLVNNRKILSTPKHVYFDNTKETRDYLSENHTLDIPENILSTLEANTHRCSYASKLPFCMGMWKQEIVDIGGYDEDLGIGWACDDDDIVDRLILNGLNFHYCEAKVIHLYHDKQYNRENRTTDPDYLNNLKIFKERKGQIIRNQGKDWGIIKRG